MCTDTKENGIKNGILIDSNMEIILDSYGSKSKRICDDNCKSSNIKKFRNGNINPDKWDKVSNDFDSNKAPIQ